MTCGVGLVKCCVGSVNMYSSVVRVIWYLLIVFNIVTYIPIA
jgi:hypothetical protein